MTCPASPSPSPSPSRRPRARCGFTLPEMLLVLLILGLMASMVCGRLRTPSPSPEAMARWLESWEVDLAGTHEPSNLIEGKIRADAEGLHLEPGNGTPATSRPWPPGWQCVGAATWHASPGQALDSTVHLQRRGQRFLAHRAGGSGAWRLSPLPTSEIHP